MDAKIEVITKMIFPPHWVVLHETDFYVLEALFMRIGHTTTTHFMNGGERQYSTSNDVIYLPEPPKPKSWCIEFYAHTRYGYTNTCPRVEYHIQYRILKRFFNLLYLAHISTARLAEQDIVMKRIKEMLEEPINNVHKTE